MDNKNKVVIYKSKSGFTKRYAQWISESLHCDIFSYKERNSVSFSDYDMIIFGGGIYAGKINGLSWFESQLPRLVDKSVIIFATGATPEDSPAIERILKQNFSGSIWHGIQVFYLQSGISYEKMGFINKIKMRIFRNIIKKTEGSDSETFRRIQKSHNLSSKTRLKPLIAFCQGQMPRGKLKSI